MAVQTRRRLVNLAMALAIGAIGRLASAEPATPIVPALPQIPDRTFQITDFGGVGDGKTMNTDAFQKAFAAIDKAGGGKLVVPKGVFLTLPLNLVSHLDLHLEAGATIQFPKDHKAYLQMEAPLPRPESLAKMDGGNTSLLYGDHLTDIAFTGSGTIDGGGAAWWKAHSALNPKPPAATAPATAPGTTAPDPAEVEAEATNSAPAKPIVPVVVGKIKGRPKMVILNECQRIHLDGLTLANSPMWFFVPVSCTDVTIENVTVFAPKSPNTDALDPTASTNVLIRNCDLDEGDDNIAVKAIGGPCSNVWIENVRSKHGHGISIGSETYGGVHDVTVQNCTFDGGDNGIRIKSARDRGNQLAHFSFSNITMDNVKNPIVIDMYYSGGKTRSTKPITPTTPYLSDVHISNVTVKNSKNAGRIVGLPEAPARDIILTNVSIEAKTGMTVADVKGGIFENVTIKVTSGIPLKQTEADLTIRP